MSECVGFNKLIEAFEIFSKYVAKDDEYVIGCEHDRLFIYCYNENVSEVDSTRLNELGFFWDDDLGVWSKFV